MFLYAFMSGASISFPHLFLRSLNEVHRSSTVGHALIYILFSFIGYFCLYFIGLFMLGGVYFVVLVSNFLLI